LQVVWELVFPKKRNCAPNQLTYGDGVSAVESFKEKPMERLAETGQLYAYKHRGFWRPMDTLRDKNELNDMWSKGTAPWALWLK